MTKKELELLAGALCDVGCWNWWEERLPRLVQLEFVGTELYLGQGQAGQPPDSQLALSFVKGLPGGRGRGGRPRVPRLPFFLARRVFVSSPKKKAPPSPPRQAGSRRASFCPGG